MKQAKRYPLLQQLAAQLNVQLNVNPPDPALPKLKDFRRWVQAALRSPRRTSHLGISIVDEVEGRRLNAEYRQKDYATNVLSFALNEGETLPGLPLVGDIVLCAPIVATEAAAQGKNLIAHYAHLTVHGVLHLQGFDHETDEQASMMETLESKLLQQLGYPNPYNEEQY